MNHPKRYRIALESFLAGLRKTEACVPSDIAETPLGATLLATALIEEACRLAREQLGEPEVQRMLEGLMHMQFQASARGS